MVNLKEQQPIVDTMLIQALVQLLGLSHMTFRWLIMQRDDSNLSLRQSIMDNCVMHFVHYMANPAVAVHAKKYHIKYTGRDITALHKMLKTLSVPVKWLLPVISSPGLSSLQMNL